MPRVVVTHRTHAEVWAMLSSTVEVDADCTDESWPRPELLARFAEADAAMVFMPDRVDGEFLAAGPRLKFVAAAAPD